jgi:competence protein ComEC
VPRLAPAGGVSGLAFGFAGGIGIAASLGADETAELQTVLWLASAAVGIVLLAALSVLTTSERQDVRAGSASRRAPADHAPSHTAPSRRAGSIRVANASLLVLCAGTLGASRMSLARVAPPGGELAAVTAGGATLVRACGVVLRAPSNVAPSTGSLSRFAPRSRAVTFPVAVDRLEDHRGRERRVEGRVLVRVAEQVAPLRPGDRVRIAGVMLPPRPALNPGEFDAGRAGGGARRAGLLVVERRAGVENLGRSSSGTLHRVRAALRRHVSRTLQATPIDVTDRSARRDALLRAMLLGERDGTYRELSGVFRRVGLAHLLAISGLHLGVLAGFVMLLLRSTGRTSRWHAAIVIAVVIVYLLIIEVRLPVLRAAIMTSVACLGALSGRRLRIGGLVALSGLALLAWRPAQLFSAGFQLSFVVVLALVHVSPRVRRAWFGPPAASPVGVGQMARQWLASATASSATAWVAALPIIVHHFGMLSPLTVPLSVVGLPLAAAVLGLGYLQVAVGTLLPSAAVVLSLPTRLLGDGLVWLAVGADRLPGSVMYLPSPPAWWTVVFLAIAATRMLWPTTVVRRLTRVLGLVLVATVLQPLLPEAMRGLSPAPLVRVDVLALRGGRCVLIRSGGSAVVINAGARGRPDVGERVVVPALRALGVRRLDAVVVDRASVADSGAVIEVVDAFRPREVYLAPAVLRAAAGDARGLARSLLAQLDGRPVALRPLRAGTEHRWGRARWRWWGTPAGALTALTVECADHRLLLDAGSDGGGDVTLLPRHGLLRVDAIERADPGGHPSRPDEPITGITPTVPAAPPAVVVCARSSDKPGAAARLHRGRAGVEYVTDRDGAVWIALDRHDMLRSGCFVETADDEPLLSSHRDPGAARSNEKARSPLEERAPFLQHP